MNGEALTKVAIYARYSTNRQDARSIHDQIRRCRALAQQRRFEVVGEFSGSPDVQVGADWGDLKTG